MFSHLPLAATIDDSIFCVHGGIPQSLDGEQSVRINTLNQIPVPLAIQPPPVVNEAPLDTQPPPVVNEVPLDIQPPPVVDELTRCVAAMLGSESADPSEDGLPFGKRTVDAFLNANGLSHVIRSHESVHDGVSVRMNATLLTIDSSPAVES